MNTIVEKLESSFDMTVLSNDKIYEGVFLCLASSSTVLAILALSSLMTSI